MRPVLLDTDILSYLGDGRHEDVAAKAGQYYRIFRYFTVSSLTVCEVVQGLQAVGNLNGVADFVRRAEGFQVLSVGLEEAIVAGKIFAALKLAGQQVGNLDPFIAAVAIVAGLPLVTNNVRHYQRIIDLGFPLELENWTG